MPQLIVFSVSLCQKDAAMNWSNGEMINTWSFWSNRTKGPDLSPSVSRFVSSSHLETRKQTQQLLSTSKTVQKQLKATINYRQKAETVKNARKRAKNRDKMNQFWRGLYLSLHGHPLISKPQLIRTMSSSSLMHWKLWTSLIHVNKSAISLQENYCLKVFVLIHNRWKLGNICNLFLTSILTFKRTMEKGEWSRKPTGIQSG